MLQNKRISVVLLGLVLSFVVAIKPAISAPTPVANTKHNLSASGTLAYKSGEGQICVFCHTPHNANPDVALLWNRTTTASTYTLYTSTYLADMGGAAYDTPVLNAGQNSRLCLSCHDGTISLGSVRNLNGTAQTIPMGGGVTTMPVGATNLGTNLADDHPVGYLYKPGALAGQDPELRSYATGPGSGGDVKLSPNHPATGRVECPSCHDPHDNQFQKFLRVSNVNGALCKTCHDKTNYAVSGHDMSTVGSSNDNFIQTGDTQGRTTVQQYSCLACHQPHTGGGKPLLKGAEELTCYNQGCHGNTTTFGTGTTQDGLLATDMRLNIQNEMPTTKTNGHKVNDAAWSGRHVDRFGGETTTELGNTNRHVECYDCHNPHQVQATVQKSTRGNLRISAALKGTWGVQPISWPPLLQTMTNNLVTFPPITSGYVKVTATTTPALTDEYQVCLKCHSNYVTLPVGARNIAEEINPNNSSYHGIVPGGQTNYYVNASTMAQPWGGTATFVANASKWPAVSVNSTEYFRQNPGLVPAATATAYANRGRVWCSDCHGSEASTMPPSGTTKTAPYGPHGSNNNGIGPGTSNSDKMLVRTIVPDAANGGTPLCLGCHLATPYLNGGAATRASRHGPESGSPARTPQGCFSCHMWENPATTGGTGDIFPHGMNKRWAKRGTSATLAGSLQPVDSFNGGWYTDINYSTKQCWNVDDLGNDATGGTCSNEGGLVYNN